ncbi:hypothetical protein Q5752_006876 [Cryptotrichosporon argae]
MDADRGLGLRVPGTPASPTSHASPSLSPSPSPLRDAPETPVAGGRESGAQRRALARSALAGLQRFKQSWVSVMLLKSSIGLGQVLTLVVLLILASVLPSPTHPETTQSTPSDTCARPQLFQAWMATNVFRLLACWSASCWMLVRRVRARRRAARTDEERAIAGQRANRRLARERERARERARCAERRAERRAASQLDSPEHTVSAQSTAPTLAHSLSTASSVSLAEHRPDAPAHAHSHTHTPGSVCVAHFSASTASLDLLARAVVDPALPKPPQHLIEHLIEHPHAHAHVPHDHDHGLGRAAHHAHTTAMSPSPSLVSATPSTSSSDSSLTPATEGGDTAAARENLDQARALLRSRDEDGDEADDEPDSAFVRFLDRLAPQLSKAMGALSFLLFILGHVLLFVPDPTHPASCIHGAPVLWWGVMAVVAVGWALALNVLAVITGVYLGGTVVAIALRRVGLLETPPTSEPARPPPPATLTDAEIDALPLVHYVPDPSEAGGGVGVRRDANPDPYANADSDASADADVTAPPLPDDIASLLAYPAVVLLAHRSTCAICHDAFVPPLPVPGRLMWAADDLRQLPCAHVYHAACVDHWLKRGSGKCPSCNTPVRPAPPGPASKPGATPGAGAAQPAQHAVPHTVAEGVAAARRASLPRSV